MSPLSSFRLWVFDLDGTLIDSRLDLAVAVNATLRERGLPDLPEERVVSFVGDGADDLIRKSLEAAGLSRDAAQAALPDALEWFLGYYGEHCLDRTLPYPGALELLDALRGRSLGVLTNKPEKPALRILAHLGILDRFTQVVPGDGPLGKKPDPAGLGYILNAVNASPTESVLVGDSLQDLKTARAAGVPFLAFLGGLGDAEAVSAAGPDLAVHALHEIRERLEAEK
jgi:phosphoglycolate phosphatase